MSADEHKKHHLDLASLIESLRLLFAQVSRRLLEHRLTERSPSSSTADSADISDALDNHLELTAADAASQEPESAASRSPAGEPKATSKAATVPPGLFTALARRFRKRRWAVNQPHLGEKMRATTNDHINQALRLARSGNVQGAKLHTELAENAMKTASQYMSDEDFRAFKEKVEGRIRSILNDA